MTSLVVGVDDGEGSASAVEGLMLRTSDWVACWLFAPLATGVAADVDGVEAESLVCSYSNNNPLACHSGYWSKGVVEVCSLSLRGANGH